MTITEIFPWACTFANFEVNQGSRREYRLDRMHALLGLLGNPEARTPCVHLAGSKGKGSTAELLGRALGTGGLRVGIYGSPHVLDWRERIRRAEGFFPDDAYTGPAQELRTLVEGLPHRSDWSWGAPTTFEILTALAFMIFAREGLDVAVLETGLGGRLDATNVVGAPILCIITHLELEHTDILGPLLTDIAREKAGIMKPGSPVLSAPQKPEALGVLQARARDLGITLEVLAPLEADTASGLPTPSFDHPGLAENRRLARRALEVLVPSQWPAMAALLPRIMATLDAPLNLPGRAMILEKDGLWVMADGAHTADSVRLSLQWAGDWLARVPGHRSPSPAPVILFALAKGKELGLIGKELARVGGLVVVTRTGTFKPSDPEEVVQGLVQVGLEAPRLVVPEVEALALALDHARQAGTWLMIVGSFYLLAETLPELARLGFRPVRRSH